MSKSVFSEQYHRFRQMLVEARNENKLTQVEMAERLGKPQSFVSKFERGERRLDVVEFIEVSQALGVDPVEFLKKFQRVSGTRKKGHQTIKSLTPSESQLLPRKKK